MTICSPMTGSQIVQFSLFEVIKKSNTKIYLLSRRDEEKFSTRLANLRKLIFVKVFRFKTHSIYSFSFICFSLLHLVNIWVFKWRAA